MDFYANAIRERPKIPICVHPILLSLSTAVNKSMTNPDINTISESDERVLTSDIYTSPSALPPLEIHILGENGKSLLHNQNDYALTSVAGCGECSPQGNSVGEGASAQGKSEAAPHAPEDNISDSSGTSPSTRRKAKKRRRALSGSVQAHRSNKRSPDIAMLIRRAKGKRAQRTGTLGANHSSSEDISNQPGRDREVEPCMFTGSSVQRFSNCFCCQPKVQMTIQP